MYSRSFGQPKISNSFTLIRKKRDPSVTVSKSIVRVFGINWIKKKYKIKNIRYQLFVAIIVEGIGGLVENGDRPIVP